MDATHLAHAAARTAHRRRRTQLLLAAAGLATVMLASACDTGEQVPWASYDSGLQVQIDSATATGNCAALRALLNTAKATSEAHEKATGFPNDALVSYIQAAQARANCPAQAG
jgi:hypothetical protein